MKKTLALLLFLCLLTGCVDKTIAEVTAPETTSATAELTFTGTMLQDAFSAPEYVSRFDSQTHITLSDSGITVEGDEEAVFTSYDIIYYQNRDAYDSGNPYGEGSDADKHSSEEANAHTVVNITAPGAYRISGKLSAGQIRVDLGNAAYYDPEAVVELILDSAEITCTVAPAILFQNVYECDGEWSVDTAKAEVDTTAAGANLILEGNNSVSGSYVARIYKDAEGEKKLWKQDGAIYSYMSLNVFGPGALDLTADNEGLDTELHLTINGGDIAIRSGNDGINTNEDGVSVTTINGGSLHIIAGLGAEGDGVDSNGYLVINGGTVVASANPAADAGLDSDMGSYINGGTVIALGSTMDWAESDSDQVTMNLQFARMQSSGSAILVTKEDGTAIFAYDPSEDEILGENDRQYLGAVISCPGFSQGETYQVYMGGVLTGEEIGGVYRTLTGYTGGCQMQYTGTDIARGFGGMGGRGGMDKSDQMPKNFQGEIFEMPEGFQPGEIPEDFSFPGGETMPENFAPGSFGGRGQRPEGDLTDRTAPEGFEGQMPAMPEGETFPEGQMPGGDRSKGGMQPSAASGEGSTAFYMNDKVNAFSGITAV